jgi:AmmeMemoRadiSam system protein A
MNMMDIGPMLLAIARSAIARELGLPHTPATRSDWLREPGASFVTLKQDDTLRGCVGSVRAQRPLLEDVTANSIAAAFHDPRFAPLAPHELAITRLEVSLLTPLEPLQFESEQHALAQLRPGIDGVVFEYGYHHSTFLPQVWDELPQPADFLVHLKRKAGLPPDFWNTQVKLERYTVSKWSEQHL